MRVEQKILQFSKKLRKDQTPWEAKLWRHLRGKRFEGFKFKRQVPIGPYIVDFCCHARRLVIELDGGQHNVQNRTSKDKKKEQYLREQGFRIIRFWNNEVDDNLNGVLTVIKECLETRLQPLSRPLSTLGERGGL